MKIEYEDCLDLWKNGIQVGTFHSKDEVCTFFENMEKRESDFFSSHDSFISSLNIGEYVVIPSRHLKFS